MDPVQTTQVNPNDPEVLRRLLLQRMFGPGAQAPSGGAPGGTPPATPIASMTPEASAKPAATPLTGPQPSQPAAPQILSESEYNAQNPAAPHTPYQAPDLKHRLLMGLFSGMQQFGRDPGAGERSLSNYLGDIEKNEEAEKNYPETSAATAHQKYMTYVQGAKAPAELENMNAELEDRRAQAQERIAHAKALANPAPKTRPVMIRDAAGDPIPALQDQASGKIIDQEGKEIPGAKMWEKSPALKDFDAFYPKYLKEHSLQDNATNEAAARKAWNLAGKETPEPGSFIPTYDPKTGTLMGAWDPKSGRTVEAPKGGGTTGTGLSAQDKREQEHQKQLAPFKSIVDEADKAQTLKDLADKGNAEADVDLALTFFKTMRSANSGGSGIRFTQQENNLIMDSRNLWDSMEVKGNKLFSNGQPLSKTQRQEILDVINVHKQAAQRQLGELEHPENAAPGGAAAPAAAPGTAGALPPGWK